MNSRRTVLIVDDEALIRTYLKAVLRREGFETVEASNGVEALEAIRNSTTGVDLLLSDVLMPEMDGIALVRAVRAEFPKTPVILMSGYFNEEQIRDVRVDFLSKPLVASTLLATIHKVTMAKKEPRSAALGKLPLDIKRETG